MFQAGLVGMNDIERTNRIAKSRLAVFYAVGVVVVVLNLLSVFLLFFLIYHRSIVGRDVWIAYGVIETVLLFHFYVWCYRRRRSRSCYEQKAAEGAKGSDP
jgi:hypothetical protein